MTVQIRHRILALAFIGVVLAGSAAWAIVTDLSVVSTLHEPRAEHIDQMVLLNLVKGGQNAVAFEEAFEHGDEFFEAEFNALAYVLAGRIRWPVCRAEPHRSFLRPST